MKRQEYFCPMCGSSDTEPNWDNAFAVSAGLYRNYRRCNSCGYSGQLFTTKDDDKPYEEVKIKRRKSWKRMLKDNLWLAIVIILLILAVWILI